MNIPFMRRDLMSTRAGAVVVRDVDGCGFRSVGAAVGRLQHILRARAARCGDAVDMETLLRSCRTGACAGGGAGRPAARPRPLSLPSRHRDDRDELLPRRPLHQRSRARQGRRQAADRGRLRQGASRRLLAGLLADARDQRRGAGALQ